ncbi:MAG: 8-oxo-dGTP diphosphatase [Frankiaceae bacterium]|nr:8-oxo-dGTP diphosphatase [Frankiaceae bacterium]
MTVIVAVALLDGHRVLTAQRSYPPEYEGLWEFPGGKVDDGEDEETAARRECAEELGVVVQLGSRLGPDVTTAGGHPLRLWLARITAGSPTAHEHRALRWLSVDELYDVEWIAADLPLVAAVEALLRGTA